MAIDKGMPIEQLQQLLGHERIDTTLRYAMIKQSNVKMAHKKYIGQSSDNDGSMEKIRLGNACDTNAESYSSKEQWTFVNYLDTGNITDNKIDSIQYIDAKREKLPSRVRSKVKLTASFILQFDRIRDTLE